MKEKGSTETQDEPGRGKLWYNNFQWYSRDCGKMWNLSSNFQSCQTSWKCEWRASSCMAHFGHWLVLLEQDYFSKYLIVRRLPNSSTHSVIKELGLVFTELGRPFTLRSDNGPCYSSREFHNFLSFYQINHVTSSPHYPQSNGFAEALVGIAKKLMEKSVKDGKPWNYGLMQYRTTPISSTLPSPLEMLTGRRPHSTLPQLPSSIGKNMETSRIREELLRRQPNTSTGAHMDLDPGQPVFVKEVSGNIWKTATVDQPAAEPDSYWVRFPDSSILRRTRSMIKPRSLPSHFKLQAEAQPWNFEGKTNSCSYDSFNQLNGNSMLPVTPMASVTTPATTDRDSKVGKSTDPIISTEALQPTVSGTTPSVPSTPRCSTRPTKGVPPDRYTPSKKWLSWNTVDASLVQDYAVIRTISV